MMTSNICAHSVYMRKSSRKPTLSNDAVDYVLVSLIYPVIFFSVAASFLRPVVVSGGIYFLMIWSFLSICYLRNLSVRLEISRYLAG